MDPVSLRQICCDIIKNRLIETSPAFCPWIGLAHSNIDKLDKQVNAITKNISTLPISKTEQFMIRERFGVDKSYENRQRSVNEYSKNVQLAADSFFWDKYNPEFHAFPDLQKVNNKYMKHIIEKTDDKYTKKSYERNMANWILTNDDIEKIQNNRREGVKHLENLRMNK
jgi:hypothetical protein